MRIILKPGGLIALLLGFALLAATVAYTRLTYTKKKETGIVTSLGDELRKTVNPPADTIEETQRYWLVNRGASVALDIWEKSAFDGAWTCVQPTGSSVTQQWNLRKNTDDDSWIIVNANTGKVLESTSAKVGTNVSQGTLTKPVSLGQRWVVQPEGDYCYLYNQSSHLVLGVGTLPNTTAQWVLQQNKDNNNQTQQWKMTAVTKPGGP